MNGILVVIDGMEVGGSQRQIPHLLRAWIAAAGSPSSPSSATTPSWSMRLVRSGVPVHYLPKRSRLDLRFLLAFARLLRRGDYALIHAFSLTAELWSVLAVRHPVAAPR